MATIDLNKQSSPQTADLRDIQIAELEHRVATLEHKISTLVDIVDSLCDYNQVYETTDDIVEKPYKYF